MKPESKLAQKLQGKEFIVTAELLPHAAAEAGGMENAVRSLGDIPVAVNVAENHYGVAISSLAGALVVQRAGREPILQVLTRDRNRIALQSDLLGAAALGIRNVLCLSGYHQSLIGSAQPANVFDIDSIQLVAAVSRMNKEGLLIDGSRIEGTFGMLAGAGANPFLKPVELNLLRLRKKIAAGAAFIQTQAVFDLPAFRLWLEAVNKEGLAGKVAILAGVMPLVSAEEAEKLSALTDHYLPPAVVERLKAAGSPEAQRKEGMAACAETLRQLKGLPGLRGVHIFSGGREAAVPELLKSAGF
jgi:methylenetetrahydrofolate reductase (NADPH)